MITNAIGTNAIGPSFAAEIAAAGLRGGAFSWGADGQFAWGASIGPEQQAAVESVFAAHNPGNADPYTAYTAALHGGVTITSTSTPTMNGVYGCAPDDTANVNVGQTAVLTNVFWGYYEMIDGTVVTMTPTEFTTLATAIMGYVVALKSAQKAALQPGGKWVAPSSSVTIA